MLYYICKGERALRPFAEKFYKSMLWKNCRKAFIKYRISIDGGMCQHCGEHPGRIVHHVIWLTPENINIPEIATGFDNLEYVCFDCHEKIEDPSKQNKRYRFDAKGNLISPLFDE